ncbi:cysteine synthase [Bradyrhizobium sp. LM4.3]
MTDAKQVKLKPGDTIGILGGGQLGRMLAMAAARLGLRCQVFSPDPDSPAFDVVLNATCAEYADVEALELFANDVDVITYEFENVPSAAAMVLGCAAPRAAQPQDPRDHPGPARREGFRDAARHRHRSLCRRHLGLVVARGDRQDRPSGGAEDPPLRL